MCTTWVMDTVFIANRMQELKLDRDALMRALDLSDSSVRNILRGLVPKQPVLMALAQVLKCKVDDLLLAARKPSAKAV